ncbi:membrane-associated protein, putative [Bodo saltans]|uniref:Membrane-associated protein, putative n=1 Tax=Bodo saltans TaxID=75058 RepID=A0A0S4JHL6_BODSA|nr:membrane-associated protein, putative [Bodo saltans]|eukprot:CUG90950.1 membrane-associated protein, putative [Bodo saltans]
MPERCSRQNFIAAALLTTLSLASLSPIAVAATTITLQECTNQTITDSDIPDSDNSTTVRNNATLLTIVVQCNHTLNASNGEQGTITINMSSTSNVSAVTVELLSQGVRSVVVASTYAIHVHLQVYLNASIMRLPALLFQENISSAQNATIVLIGDATGVVHTSELGDTGLLLFMPSFFVAQDGSSGSFATLMLKNGAALQVVGGTSVMVLGNIANDSWTSDLIVAQGGIHVTVFPGSNLTIVGTSQSRDGVVGSLLPDACSGAAALVCSTSTNTTKGQYAFGVVNINLVNSTMTLMSGANASSHILLGRFPPRSLFVTVANASTLLLQGGEGGGGKTSSLMAMATYSPTAADIVVAPRLIDVVVVVRTHSVVRVVSTSYDSSSSLPAASLVTLFSTTTQVPRAVTNVLQTLALSVTMFVQHASAFQLVGPKSTGISLDETIALRSPVTVNIGNSSQLSLHCDNSSVAQQPSSSAATIRSSFLDVIFPDSTVFPLNESSVSGVVNVSLSAASSIMINNSSPLQSSVAFVRCSRSQAAVVQLVQIGGVVQLSEGSGLTIAGNATFFALPALLSVKNASLLATTSSYVQLNGTSSAFVSADFSFVTGGAMSLSGTGGSLSLDAGASLMRGAYVQDVSISMIGTTVNISGGAQLLRALQSIDGVELLLMSFTCQIVSAQLLYSFMRITNVVVHVTNRSSLSLTQSNLLTSTFTASNSSVVLDGGGRMTLQVVSSVTFSASLIDVRLVVDGTSSNVTALGASVLLRSGSSQAGSSVNVSATVRAGGVAYASGLFSSIIGHTANCCNATVVADGSGSMILVDSGASVTWSTLSANVSILDGATMRIGGQLTGTASAGIRNSQLSTVTLQDGATMRLTSSTSVVMDLLLSRSVVYWQALHNVTIFFDSSAKTNGWLAMGATAATGLALHVELDNVTFQRPMPTPAVFSLPSPLASTSFTDIDVVVGGKHDANGACIPGAFVRKTLTLIAPLVPADFGLAPAAFHETCIAAPTMSLSKLGLSNTASHHAGATTDLLLPTHSTRLTRATEAVTTSPSLSLIFIPPATPAPPLVSVDTVQQVGAAVAVGATIAGAAGVAPSVVRAALSASLLDCESLSLYGPAVGNYFQLRIGEDKGGSHRGLLAWATSVIVGCCILTYASAVLLRYFFTEIMRDSMVTLRICLTKMYMPGLLSVPFLLLLPSLVAAAVALVQVSVSDAAIAAVVLLVVAFGCSVAMGWVLTSPSFFGARFYEQDLYADAEEQDTYYAKQRISTLHYPRLLVMDKFFYWCLDGETRATWYDLPGHGGFMDRFGRWFQFYRPGRQWYLMVEIVVSCICAIGQGVAANGAAASCRTGQVLLGVTQIVAFLLLLGLYPYVSRVRMWVSGIIGLMGALFGVLLLFLPICSSSDGTTNICRNTAEILTLLPSAFAAIMPLIRLAVAITSTALDIGFQSHHPKQKSPVNHAGVKSKPTTSGSLDEQLLHPSSTPTPIHENGYASSSSSLQQYSSTPPLKSGGPSFETNHISDPPSAKSPPPSLVLQRHDLQDVSNTPELRRPPSLLVLPQLLYARSDNNPRSNTTPLTLAPFTLPHSAASVNNLSFSLQGRLPMDDYPSHPVNGSFSFLAGAAPPAAAHQRFIPAASEEQLEELTNLVEWACSEALLSRH